MTDPEVPLRGDHCAVTGLPACGNHLAGADRSRIDNPSTNT